MTISTLPPGAFTPERITEIARLGQTDPVVRGYRSFHSLAEGRIVWLLNAPSKEAVTDWCRKVGLPMDAITELELEGFVGNIRPARMGIPNQLPATVEGVEEDELLAIVRLRLASGDTVVAMLDDDETDRLGLAPGAEVVVLIKATHISLSSNTKGSDNVKLSFPNQIEGKVTSIIASTTLVIVHIETPAGKIVSALIPSAAEQIELKVGDTVTALFKALDVSLAKA